MLERLRARLFNALLTALGARSEAYVKEAIEAAAARAAHEAGAACFHQGHAVGYQIGLAHGELKGRDDLALELQIEHGMDGACKEMSQDELATLRIRQVH